MGVSSQARQCRFAIVCKLPVSANPAKPQCVNPEQGFVNLKLAFVNLHPQNCPCNSFSRDASVSGSCCMWRTGVVPMLTCSYQM